MSMSTPQKTVTTQPNRGLAVDGYHISEGRSPVTPRRTAVSLGKGGELWRLKPVNLYASELKARDEVKASGLVDSAEVSAAVARRMAGICAEAQAGYSVDERHEWLGLGRHSQYIHNPQARVVAAGQAIEDTLDALHALDRLSDANIICIISLHETSPTQNDSEPIIHQFASRPIMRNIAYSQHVDTFVSTFRESIALPAAKLFTRSIRDPYYIPPPVHRVNRPTDAEIEEQSTAPITIAHENMDESEWFGTSARLTQSHPPALTGSPSSTSSISSIPSSLTASPILNNCPLPVPAAVRDALDFGVLAEGAFHSLNLEESVVLHIKLISRVVEQSQWRNLFEILGLNKEAAALLTLILSTPLTSD